MNLGGDLWPIYIDPTGEDNVTHISEAEVIVKEGADPGIKVDLNPGDMLIYRGNELEHWREPFQGEDCVQVFLHYNNTATKGSKENLFDKRPHLGLPPYFKRK